MMSFSNGKINDGEKPKPRNRTMFGLGPDTRRARALKASKEGIKKAANSDFGQDLKNTAITTGANATADFITGEDPIKAFEKGTKQIASNLRSFAQEYPTKVLAAAPCLG